MTVRAAAEMPQRSMPGVWYDQKTPYTRPCKDALMIFHDLAPVPFAHTALMHVPLQSWQTGVRVATMLGEAQMVVAYRVLGHLGLWSTAPGETARMVREKPAAFAQAVAAAVGAAQAGRRPDEILAAAVMPLGRRTRSNMRRLARRGSRLAK